MQTVLLGNLLAIMLMAVIGMCIVKYVVGIAGAIQLAGMYIRKTRG